MNTNYTIMPGGRRKAIVKFFLMDGDKLREFRLYRTGRAEYRWHEHEKPVRFVCLKNGLEILPPRSNHRECQRDIVAYFGPVGLTANWALRDADLVVRQFENQL